MKNKIKIVIAFLVAICIASIGGYKMCDYNRDIADEKYLQLQWQFEMEKREKELEPSDYVYPQEKDEEHHAISISYTEDVLARKTNGEKLTENEEALILNYALQENGKGLAYTRFMEHDGGMGKATRRMWETADGGQCWNIITEEQYSLGHYDLTYINDIVIQNAFSSTAQRGYFNISYDGGHTFTYIPFKDIFTHEGGAYPKKIGENVEKGTVTYQWCDLSHNPIEVIEYDLTLTPVK